MEESIKVALAAIRGKTQNRKVVANWGVVTDGEIWTEKGWSMCHSNFGHSPAKFDVLYNVTMTGRTQPGTEEARYAFYAWLFGPWSPYVSILGDYYNDPADIDRYGYILPGASKVPANLLYNLIIASRFPTEQNAHVNRWWEWVKGGVHPALAYWAVYAAGQSNPNPNHQSFDWLRTHDDYVIRMATGRPLNLSPSRSEFGQGRPCNIVWADMNLHNSGGTSGNTYHTTVQDRTKEKWRELYPDALSFEFGTFKNPTVALECLLKEQQRLGI